MAGASASLYAGQPATTTPAPTVFTAANKVLVKEIIVTNVTDASATVDVHFGVGGAAAAAANAFMLGVLVPARSVVIFALNKVMANTDVIRARQATASALTVHVSGVTNAP